MSNDSGTAEVVVTGLGVVTPVGVGIDKLWEALKTGRSGVRRVDDKIDLTNIKSKIGAMVPDFDPTERLSKKRVRRLGRSVQFGLVAAGEAIEDSGLKGDKKRIGVIVGTGVGDIKALTENHNRILEKGARKVSPFFIPQLMPNATSAQIAMQHGFKGTNFGAVSACASGSHAIGAAYDAIRRGRMDAAIAGGTEAAMIRLAFAGFDRMQALSTHNEEPKKASRPFDNQRDGFIMAEGAGIVVLEKAQHARNRGVQPYATLSGFGGSADAHHVTAPPDDGEGARLAMRRALEDACLSTNDVDYINAHGTSTPKNDQVETRAIKDLFQEQAYELAVSSTKSQTGHLVGAGGGVEAVVSVLALHHGYIPPTVNYEHPDPECDLDYVPNEGREEEIQVAMSNSFGFGGQNGTVILEKI